MKTLKTKYGSMNIYASMEELEGFSYEGCIAWLSFNDRNGCYSIDDQMGDFGEIASLEEMKQFILDQSSNA